LSETGKANEIIAQEVANFITWITEREAVPVIDSLRKKCEKIRLDELERIRNRVDGETYEILDQVTRRILRKMLHQPTVRVRSTESEEFRKQLIDSIRELFITEEESEFGSQESGERNPFIL
jgi:glutamyl-tRNA reductase